MERVYYHVGISGGKDSTAALLYLRHECGIAPEDLVATFCDTKNEHPITLDYIQMLSETVHPIRTLEPRLGFMELAQSKGRFPSARARFCTETLKLDPSMEFLAEYLERGEEIISHSGVRATESPGRASLKESECTTIHKNGSYYELEIRRPLLRWSLEEVWNIHKRYGIAPNPLYKMGFERVGCMLCVMSRKSEVRLVAEKFPERIDRIREAELEIESGFFHANTVPESQRTRDYTTKAGEHMKVASIDDVVRWSRTSRGGQQYDFSFEDGPNDGTRPCSNKFGLCE